MLKKARAWFFSQPVSERSALLVWLATLVGMIVLGLMVAVNYSSDTSVYYYLVGLFIVDSVIFFSLYRQLPTIRVVMLTLLIVLELSTLGYYLVTRTAVFL